MNEKHLLEFDPSEEQPTVSFGTLSRREFLGRVGGGVVVLFTTVPRFTTGDEPSTEALPGFNAYLRIGERLPMPRTWP